jgi:carboxyl-terminal processing protease
MLRPAEVASSVVLAAERDRSGTNTSLLNEFTQGTSLKSHKSGGQFMALRRRDWGWLVLMAAVVIWGGQLFNHVEALAQDAYGNVGQLADDRAEVETAILRYYVEDVDPAKLQTSQIDGMLAELDIYSDFLSEREQEDLRMTTEGAFGGLGIEINAVDHYPTVISPLEGTPAWEVGMQSGDKIVEIEGVSTYDVKLDIVVGKLRGVPGTVVSIKVQRPGVSEAIQYRITRAEIHVNSVQFAGMVWDPQAEGFLPLGAPEWLRSGERVGYIRLSTFARGATDEVAAALRSLVTKRPRGVILDLRMNPGGLLEEARGVADLFLPKGRLIVSTKGRLQRGEQSLVSQSDPILPPSVPLVVLVDEGSASASEIVAGAIQDNDRGLIVGRPTFGKGSVQTVYNSQFSGRFGLNFSKNALLKLTTAYYYSPSGRCIHKPRWRAGKRAAVISKSTSDTATVYRTVGHREVHGGGGIAVDVKVEPEIPPAVFWQLSARQLFFNYAVDYAVSHPDVDPRTFDVTDAMVADFRRYVSDTSRAFTYEPRGKQELENLEKVAVVAKYGVEVTRRIAELRDVLISQQESEFERADPYIRQRLRSSVAGRAWGRKARTRADFTHDSALRQAVDYLADANRYAHQLALSPPRVQSERTDATAESAEE